MSKPVDVILIGSQINSQNINKDFDILLIHENDLNLIESRATIRKMRQTIKERIKGLIISLKLFSLAELGELGYYDGFRLASYKSSFFSRNNTKFLNDLSPNLNYLSFKNSIMIQIVYTSTKYDDKILRSKSVIKACQKWYDINNKIFQLHNGGLSQLIEEDELLKKLYLASITGELTTIMDYLPLYFDAIPHENINKYEIYTKKLKRTI